MPRTLRSGSPSILGGGMGGVRPVGGAVHTAYGTVPGPIATPPNVYSQLKGVYPNLSADLGLGQGNIRSELAGELSPDTINAIQDEAARFGVTSGMPLSQFAGNRGLRNLGLNVETQKRQGLSDLTSLLGSLGPTMTRPELQYEVDLQNALNAAAPDPQLAADEQFRRWEQMFNKVYGQSGLPRPSSGTFYPPIRGGMPGVAPIPVDTSYSEPPIVAMSATPGTYQAPAASQFDWNAWIRGLLPNPSGGGNELGFENEFYPEMDQYFEGG